ncbi:RNA-binding S4 domain-containing protein [Nesterenkonia sp. F]|uniref:RNA-binding S4 domain-containing protein n=1 Tax=Nesterenkonia sp. F TaxID=795955 RepID=UPI000255CF6D
MSEEHQDERHDHPQDEAVEETAAAAAGEQIDAEADDAADDAVDEDFDEAEFIEVDQIPIRDESIRLGQLLKLADVVEHGGMAREVLDAGAVTVDDEVETRRGRQIRPGEIVQLDGEALGLPEAAITPVAEE